MISKNKPTLKLEEALCEHKDLADKLQITVKDCICEGCHGYDTGCEHYRPVNPSYFESKGDTLK